MIAVELKDILGHIQGNMEGDFRGGAEIFHGHIEKGWDLGQNSGEI